jgi:hypothetical protein
MAVANRFHFDAMWNLFAPRSIVSWYLYIFKILVF